MAVDKGRAYALRERGWTLKEISQELGCSETHIRTMLAGVPKGVVYKYASVEDDLMRISKELMEIAKNLGK